MCWYHGQVLDGFIDSDGKGVKRFGVRASDVVSDEQRELAAMLDKLGARRDVIVAALNRSA